MRAALPTAAALALSILLSAGTIEAKPRWQLVYSEVNTGNAILSLDAIDANTAWAVGISQQMSSSTPIGIRTTDGVTWSPMALPPGTGAAMEISLFTTLAFNDADKGWMGGMRASFTGQAGIVWRTDNGGMTWQEVFASPNMPTQIQALPGGAMFAAAGPVILASPDGQQVVQLTPALPAQTQLNGIAMLTETCGYAVASIPAEQSNESSAVLWTADGGSTWEVRAEGLDYRIERVAFASAKLGWAAGSRGNLAIIASTSDGGRTWSEVAIPDHPAVMGAETVPATACVDVRFFDDKRGVGLCLACTGNCEPVEGGGDPSFLTVFVRSDDGGRSWQFDPDYEEQMAAPPFPQMSKFSGMLTMDFAGPNAGFIGGQNNLILRYVAEQPEPEGWGAPSCDEAAGGGGASGGTGGSSSGGPGAAEAAESDSGCGCRVSSQSSPGLLWLSVLSALLGLSALRRSARR